jgi:hypothetical protein
MIGERERENKGGKETRKEIEEERANENIFLFVKGRGGRRRAVEGREEEE